MIVATLNVVAVILLFILLYFIGTKINEHTRNKNNLDITKKRKTKREEVNLQNNFISLLLMIL